MANTRPNSPRSAKRPTTPGEATTHELALLRLRAERIGQQLEALYPNPPVPLDHRDPYTLLVAVALSAQTTDKKVNEVTPQLFDRAQAPAGLDLPTR